MNKEIYYNFDKNKRLISFLIIRVNENMSYNFRKLEKLLTDAGYIGAYDNLQPKNRNAFVGNTHHSPERTILHKKGDDCTFEILMVYPKGDGSCDIMYFRHQSAVAGSTVSKKLLEFGNAKYDPRLDPLNVSAELLNARLFSYLPQSSSASL